MFTSGWIWTTRGLAWNNFVAFHVILGCVKANDADLFLGASAGET